MPLKRSKALQPLSRQHHNGLLLCLLLKKGVKKEASPDVMAAFVSHFWKTDLSAHFAAEERVLLPLASGYEVLKDELNRMTNEHAKLSGLIDIIANNPSTALILQLSIELEKHIRFEEQILFPLVESAIPTELLSTIGEQFEENDKNNCMNYEVKFWE